MIIITWQKEGKKKKEKERKKKKTGSRNRVVYNLFPQVLVLLKDDDAHKVIHDDQYKLK